ncbi:MAG: CRISPR-associated protein Cas4 [Candidatus Gastranaerophilales bacterium]|nr:CRISPR-associated protein Cas4 [Candidatus Gastranaerophilales bacterium]
MEYEEEDFLLLSGIQHFAFCRRQWALIHIEQQWEENVRTFEGRSMHENAHNPFYKEKRGGILSVRAMKVFSRSLGVSGECDLVEFHADPQGVPLSGREGLYRVVPVEYKRGAPKSHDADELQLTAQAMCLEEMLQTEIELGYLYYGETKHRKEVELTAALREKVKDSLKEMHRYYESSYTPKVKAGAKCKQCSLQNICVPDLGSRIGVKNYIEAVLGEETR